MMLICCRWIEAASYYRTTAILLLSLCMWFCPYSAGQAQPSKKTADSLSILTGVDIEETDPSASVTFFINEPSDHPAVDYKVASSVSVSRKWIDLILPTVRAGIRGNVASGGTILGDIIVENTPVGDGTRISIEILAASVNYVIRQEDGQLIFRAIAE